MFMETPTVDLFPPLVGAQCDTNVTDMVAEDLANGSGTCHRQCVVLSRGTSVIISLGCRDVSSVMKLS